MKVKKVLKIFGVFCIAFLYTVAVFTENVSAYDATYFSFSQNENSGFITTPSSALHSHTQVNIIYDFTAISFPKIKDVSEKFIVSEKNRASKLFYSFEQYSNYNAFFPLPFSKPDIVFPFHEFL